MVMSYKAGPELGMLEVHTTDEGGHPTEFWAKLCIDKIIQVSDEAPENVKEQVKAYRDNIEKVINESKKNKKNDYNKSGTIHNDFLLQVIE